MLKRRTRFALDYLIPWSLISLLLLTHFGGLVNSLRCWRCIADNCGSDPSSHPHASKEHCQLGRYCQKVYYEVMSVHERKTYISTVRSCAKDCKPRNDFMNCSQTRLENRGCSWRVCCRDKDLCNSAPPTADTVRRIWPLFYILPIIWLVY